MPRAATLKDYISARVTKDLLEMGLHVKVRILSVYDTKTFFSVVKSWMPVQTNFSNKTCLKRFENQFFSGKNARFFL